MPRSPINVCPQGHDKTVTGRYGRACAECSRERTRAYFAKHKKSLIAKHKRRQTLSRYGLTELAYNALAQKQGNKCAVCNAAPSVSRHLTVDHDHRTGAVRGLLCINCNSMLGMAHDDVRVLEAGIEYLKTN